MQMSDTNLYHVPIQFRVSRPVLKTVFRGIFHVLANVKILFPMASLMLLPLIISRSLILHLLARFGLNNWKSLAQQMYSINRARDGC
jgi:hypothetical protein